MKKLLLLLTLILLFANCKKNSFNSAEASENHFSNTSLQWLNNKIAKNNLVIKENPESILSFAAWISYKHNNKTYYEFDYVADNIESGIYDQNGKRVEESSWDYLGYQEKKCCKTILWKGNNYRYLRPEDDKPTLKRFWGLYIPEMGLNGVQNYRPNTFNYRGMMGYLLLFDNGKGKFNPYLTANEYDDNILNWYFDDNTRILELNFTVKTPTGDINIKKEKYKILDLTLNNLKMQKVE